MALTNTSKPSTTLTNTARVAFAELWSTITTTWASETRTWADMASLIDNAAKPIASVSSGPLSPGTMESDSSTGSTAWGDFNNAKVLDGSYSSIISFGGFTSQLLKASNFGFAIPTNATIRGVTIRVSKYVDTATLTQEIAAKLVKGGVVSGSNRAQKTWPTSLQYVTYGGVANMWGNSLSPADVNASDFGFVLQVQNISGAARSFYVDHIECTITYEINGTTFTNTSKPV